MSLNSIIGQPLAVDLVKRWVAQKTNNPLLFYGPEGVGKRTLALEAAKVLNCKGTSPLTPTLSHKGRGGFIKELPLPNVGEGGGEGAAVDVCGYCLSCKKIATGVHPDVRVIDLAYQAEARREPLEKQQALRIETVLEERRRLLQSAVEGTWKVTIVDDAHRLTPDAANVLLKILEEPPARVAIFLLTPFRDKLFATVVSRCQPVRFRPLTDEEMRQCLSAQKVPADSQMRWVELALGSPGQALKMNREEHIQSLQEAEALWAALPAKEPAEVLGKLEPRTKAARFTRPEVEQRVQHLLVPAWRDLRAGHAETTRSVQLLQDALTQLRQNVQPQLVYDHLLLKLAGERKP